MTGNPQGEVHTMKTAQGDVTMKFTRPADSAQNTPLPVNDQDLEDVAGGTTIDVYFGSCAHQVEDTGQSISDIFAAAQADHAANCV